MILDPKHILKDFDDIKPMGFLEPEILEEDYQALGATKVPDEILKEDGQKFWQIFIFLWLCLCAVG